MPNFSIIYSRFGSVESDEYETIESAKGVLQMINDDCQGFEIGIYDHNKRILYISDAEVIGVSLEDLKSLKISEAKTLNLQIDDVQIIPA